MPVSSLSELRALCASLPLGSEDAAREAAARQDTLTKPQGSLGRLEELAVWLARWQNTARPELNKVGVLVFAGSHGVTARGVSAFPAEVTAQMVANFAHGGAAINQLAQSVGAELKVIPLEVERPTADFTQAPAMSESEFLQAVSAGMDAVEPDTQLLCLGEMGIGNTTVAAAVAAGLFGGDGATWVGRGTGVDDQGLARKASAVDDGLARHAAVAQDPLLVLSHLGGRELAAMFGAALQARREGIPILLDGFVSTAACAPLARLAPGSLAHAMAAHVSAEAGHRRLLDALGLEPLLDFRMRLGEASGACLAVGLLRSALACHNGMASFAEAGVSEK
ncbi:MAG: nicotinate-nucleotide--dimethylbenzimidazole phosphoribosyltransferase [Methylobacterium mesophilicum]|nr:nicotinate-nucleotide--dimethylbenzimidazole phosphoribosyltransferase [Methylobacterium mesophilicum]